MTKWALSDPRVALAIARRLPAAVRLALDPGSRKNERKPAGYPARLTALERLGMLAGPFLFAGEALRGWRINRGSG
jgi:hypothetical protein